MERKIGKVPYANRKNNSQFLRSSQSKQCMLNGNVMMNHEIENESRSVEKDDKAFSRKPIVSELRTVSKKITFATAENGPVNSRPVTIPTFSKPSAILVYDNLENISTTHIRTFKRKNSNKASNGVNNVGMGRRYELQYLSASNHSTSRGRSNRNNASLGRGCNYPLRNIYHHQQQPATIAQNDASNGNYPQHSVLDKLRAENNYNPKKFDLNPKNVRFFVIKSFSEDDIHKSIKYSIWCSTELGNKRLNQAFREAKGPVYLFYSVNGSGHFCGMAQMTSPVDYDDTVNVWAQNKWKGRFKVKWIYVKDVPNSRFHHICLENNENKCVTNSRDAQEVTSEKGKQVLKIIHAFGHTTSIFDDFVYYEKIEEQNLKFCDM